MNSAVEGIRHTALKHSRRAARLWQESAAVIRGAGETLPREQAVRKAAELNEKALDECTQALRSIEFLRRYSVENS